MGMRLSVIRTVTIICSCVIPLTNLEYLDAQQQACPPLEVATPDPSKFLLTPQLEMDLGDIIAEQMQRNFLVIDEDGVTRYLRIVGDRVARQLPASDIHYQFFLYDQPEIEAFSLPGGRVYVSRKMVAFLRNEDELAGLLGHEMGHLVTRQGNFYFSRLLHDVLGVQSLRDREDVFDKYNELMESRNLRKAHPEKRSESDRGQMIADRIGVEATVRAGYAPQPFVDSLDRVMQTKGKTGTWLSDLFGATKPDAKRLRELLKDVSALPSTCVASRPVAAPAEFHQWQDTVLRYKGIGHAEKLHDVLFRRTLNDPIRADIENFRFSPDGKYILAQDEGGISVLTREPFAFKFRFDAHRAQHAFFSQNSRQILFSTRDFHVEIWDLETQERVSLFDVSIIHGCLQSALSPDGKFLACLNSELDLAIYDAASGQELFRKDKLLNMNGPVNPLFGLILLLKLVGGQDVAVLRFSPDSRYFAAVLPGTDDPILLSLPDAQKLRIPGSLRTALASSFTFLAPDRVFGVDRGSDKSPIIGVPSGVVLAHVPLGRGSGALEAASNSRYVFARPIRDHPVGAYDLESQKWVFANRNSAVDIWGDVSISERLNGEIGLYKVGELKPFSVLQLPLGHIGILRTSSVSPDLRWLAASAKSRGAIWDLEQNQRIFFSRGFRYSFSVSPEIFYLSFPEFQSDKPALVAFSGGTHKSVERILEKDDDLRLMGKISVRRKHSPKERDPRRDVTIDIIETEKGQTLWTRTFQKEAPVIHGDRSPGRLIFVWSTRSDGAKEEFSRNPDLRPKLAPNYSMDSDYFIEVVDANNGSRLRGLSFNSAKGDYTLESAESIGDWLVISDSANRVLLLSLSNGEVKARYFGSDPVFSPGGDLLSIANERGQLRLYDMHSLQRVDELAFSSHILMDAFSSDAKKLLVMTDDQTVYLLDLTKLPAFGSTATSAH